MKTIFVRAKIISLFFFVVQNVCKGWKKNEFLAPSCDKEKKNSNLYIHNLLAQRTINSELLTLWKLCKLYTCRRASLSQAEKNECECSVCLNPFVPIISNECYAIYIRTMICFHVLFHHPRSHALHIITQLFLDIISLWFVSFMCVGGVKYKNTSPINHLPILDDSLKLNEKKRDKIFYFCWMKSLFSLNPPFSHSFTIVEQQILQNDVEISVADICTMNYAIKLQWEFTTLAIYKLYCLFHSPHVALSFFGYIDHVMV